MSESTAVQSRESRELQEARARVATLERALARSRAACTELESIVEDKTRHLFVVLEEVKRQARAIRSQAAAAIVGDAPSLAAAAPRMLESLAESMGWEFASFWAVDAEAGVLRCSETWHRAHLRAPRFAAMTRQVTFARGVGLPGRTWESKKSEWISDVVTDPNFPRVVTAREEGLHAGCAFPILLGGDVVAVIEFFSSKPNETDPELLETLDAIGAQIGATLEHRRIQRELRDRDMELARRIQTSILPVELAVAGLEIAARMVPADEVGGDYYDVIPCDGGCWIGIGDVTGHGLGAGLIMLMVQSAVAALCRAEADVPAGDRLHALNAMLYENIQRRLGTGDHVTFSLMHFHSGGLVRFAGAHEDFLVWRAATRRCEIVETSGKWLGVVRDLGARGRDFEVRLDVGDRLILYTDGITEAMNASHQHFGLERLMSLVEQLADEPSAAIADAVIEHAKAWGVQQTDDMTVVAIRRSS